MFGRFKNYMNESIATLSKPSEPKSKPPPNEQTPKKDQPPQEPKPKPKKETSVASQPVKKEAPPSSASNTSIFDTNTWVTSLDNLLGRPKKIIEQQVEGSDVSAALWKKNIPTNIGFPILRNYENIWTMLHENNIDLGRAAERTDRILHSAIGHANKHHKALREFEKGFEALPSLLERLNKTVQLVENVRDRIVELEENYEIVAKQRLDKSFSVWKKGLSDAVISYEQSKKVELKQYENKLRVEKQRADREQLIHENLQRLQEVRDKESEKLREIEEHNKKQRALEDAFREQLAEFKNTKLSSTKQEPEISDDVEIENLPEEIAQPENSVTLDQVDLVGDLGDLESFLDDVEEDEQSFQEENSEEEFPSIEILTEVEDPSAEYERLLHLEKENLVLASSPTVTNPFLQESETDSNIENQPKNESEAESSTEVDQEQPQNAKSPVVEQDSSLDDNE